MPQSDGLSVQAVQSPGLAPETSRAARDARIRVADGPAVRLQGGRIGSWWSRPRIEEYDGRIHRRLSLAARRDTATRLLLEEAPRPEVTPAAEYFGAMAYWQIYGEDIGGRAAEALLAAGLPADLRAGLIRAMWDELRHSDMLYELTADLEERQPWGAVLGLSDILDEASDELEFAILHTELEALALDTFKIIKDWGGQSVFGRVYAAIASDEASHIGLGREIVEEFIRRGFRIGPARLERLLTLSAKLSTTGNETATGNVAFFIGQDYGKVDARLRASQAQRHDRLRLRLVSSALQA